MATAAVSDGQQEASPRKRQPRNSRLRRHRRTVLFNKQHGRCFWCKQPMLLDAEPGNPLRATLDHLTPVGRGGTNAWDNLVACCEGCNHTKGKRWVPPKVSGTGLHPLANALQDALSKAGVS